MKPDSVLAKTAKGLAAGQDLGARPRVAVGALATAVRVVLAHRLIALAALEDREVSEHGVALALADAAFIARAGRDHQGNHDEDHHEPQSLASCHEFAG